MKTGRVPINLPLAVAESLVSAARDEHPVSGLTHNFYRYPARFSPVFARAVINAFTLPGDYVLDPHVGGGTSLVEAMALGRHAVGVDISALAEFVTAVKTTILTERDVKRLLTWTEEVGGEINAQKASATLLQYAELGYYRHMDHSSRWRLRKGIEQALESASRLRASRVESFARCVILRTAQWALDGRRKSPSIGEFRRMLTENARQMLAASVQLKEATERYADTPTTIVLQRSAAGLDRDLRLAPMPPPKLVLTSPPYPGVHVLYHRWQVDGRKEAPLPFMIAKKLDGAGSSYYTMGDRKYPELRTYFENIKATMSSMAALADKRTIVVQMVAFSEPKWQLPRYLRTMEEAGLHELHLSLLRGERDGRLWRTVPRRRWYSDQRGETPASQEVVLFHRKADDAPMQPRRQLPTETPWCQ